ncbi:MAG: GNAT family N-acetyltransferase [Anaerolineae bacterium]|nr:GNAT family N-acetyltransferase [Anaerolineae bacterium]NUQ06406.1 GNAT family N-acetyltransferase [Anaerolineae bacterium]
MPIQFRLATPDDLPALQQLIPDSVRALSAGFYTPAQIEGALVHIFGVDTQLIADGTYYAAASDGQIVGCGGWSRRKTLFGGDQMKAAADSLLDPALDAARIRAFFVHPAWARRGIGRRIIELCEAAARRDGFRRAELVATLPGEPLYAALSYAVMRRFEVPMPGGEALPVASMAKEFQEPP